MKRQRGKDGGQDRCGICAPFLLSKKKNTNSMYSPYRGKWKHEALTVHSLEPM